MEVYLCFFTLGKDETEVEKLCSILIQMEYQYQVNYWYTQGVPFKDHLYVPEVHPDTYLVFCEWEDEGHVFKVSHAQVGDAMASFIHVHTYICGLLQALEPALTKLEKEQGEQAAQQDK